MQGYKTYVGLIMIILGWFGVGDWITESQVGEITNVVVQLVGMVIALYGNYRSHHEIKALGGYR